MGHVVSLFLLTRIYKMKKLSPMEQKASSKVLEELRSHAKGMMNDKMKGLKKVTVASNSKEGLKEGLSKAEEIIGAKKSSSDLTKSPMGEEFGKSKLMSKMDEAHPEEIDGLETQEHEDSESDEYEAGEQEGMDEECSTPEEVDAKIKELMALKAHMLSNK